LIEKALLLIEGEWHKWKGGNFENDVIILFKTNFMNLLLQRITFLFCITFLCCACKQEIKSEKIETSQQCFDKIPDITLPFTTNTSVDLHSQIDIDTTCNAYIPLETGNSITGIYGKICINDSILAIIYLYAGDMSFPYLVTFKNKKIIDKLFLLNLPGGSTGEGENGSSTLIIENKNTFVITDTINTYTFDPERGGNIESTKQTKIEKKVYKIGKDAKIVLEKQ
jgi:hypothetical protein